MGFEKEILTAGNGVMPQKGIFYFIYYWYNFFVVSELCYLYIYFIKIIGQNVTVHCTGFGKDRDLNLKV